LLVKDVKKGSGKPVEGKFSVRVKYAGRLESGKVFDSGTISFKLGAGAVIKGWDSGVAGMRVGGRRHLTIPPALAYGRDGSFPSIPPDATLLFDVELLSAKQLKW
jgi:FKBP-type peptidyl-prolyl cis-trans isomerase